MTKFDKARLEELIADAEALGGPPRADLEALAGELAAAEVVASTEVPPTVVTMNSKVELRDVDTGESMTYVLTFPQDANIDDGAISVLAPIGTAILGYSIGDLVEWQVPAGVCRLRIEAIPYQPEAAGDFHL